MPEGERLRLGPVRVVGRGAKVFDAEPVRGRWCLLQGPDEVIALMDTTAAGVVAAVRDAGATFLTPLYDELTAIVCTGGTPRSHIGIVSREFQLPCVMGAVFQDGEPGEGALVEVDCSGGEGVIRA
jgi:signal transduction protein with GAF and PtsI domain